MPPSITRRSTLEWRPNLEIPQLPANVAHHLGQLQRQRESKPITQFIALLARLFQGAGGDIGIVTVLHERMHQIDRFQQDFGI